MKLDYQSSSLVILGGWNPNIFSPFWIEKRFRDTNFLDALDPNNPEKGKLNFDIQLGETYSIKHAPMTVRFNGVKIDFTDGRLVFKLSEGDNFNILEEFALKLCSHLPDTPVMSYGVNFEFVEGENTQVIKDIMQLNGMTTRKYFSSPLKYERYGFGVDIDNINTNISIETDNANKFFFKFNFHFNINDLSQFISGISKNPITMLLEKAVIIISEAYKLNVEV